VLLNVVVPLWLVERTDAPHTVLAWLFGTNTVMAVLLQVRAARGSETVAGSVRAVRRSALCFVASCAIISVTHETGGWATTRACGAWATRSSRSSSRRSTPSSPSSGVRRAGRVIAAIACLASVISYPAARAAERHLVRVGAAVRREEQPALG